MMQKLLLVTVTLLRFSLTLAGGDHSHSPSPPPPASGNSYTVDWVIPGAHSHNGQSANHATSVELGEGKRLVVNVGDSVRFQWSGNSHNLEELTNESLLGTCDFTGSTQLAATATTGDFSLDTTHTKTYFLSCQVSGHCAAHQKLMVEVVHASSCTSVSDLDLQTCLSTVNHRMPDGTLMNNSAMNPDPCVNCIQYPCTPDQIVCLNSTIHRMPTGVLMPNTAMNPDTCSNCTVYPSRPPSSTNSNSHTTHTTGSNTSGASGFGAQAAQIVVLGLARLAFNLLWSA